MGEYHMWLLQTSQQWLHQNTVFSTGGKSNYITQNEHVYLSDV